VIPFMERVTEQIAKDYRQIIAAEMFIRLIKERILNDYYRHINVSLKCINLCI